MRGYDDATQRTFTNSLFGYVDSMASSSTICDASHKKYHVYSATPEQPMHPQRLIRELQCLLSFGQCLHLLIRGQCFPQIRLSR